LFFLVVVSLTQKKRNAREISRGIVREIGGGCLPGNLHKNKKQIGGTVVGVVGGRAWGTGGGSVGGGGDRGVRKGPEKENGPRSGFQVRTRKGGGGPARGEPYKGNNQREDQTAGF